MRLVEAHETVGQRLAGHHLEFRVERGADREPAFVELLLAVLLVDLAADFLGEIFRGEHVGAGRMRRDVERLLLGLLAFLLFDVAVLDHTADHVVSSRDRRLALAKRMKIARSFGQRREIGSFRNRKFVHRFVEIEKRGGGHSIGAEAEIDFVEVELENLLFRISALDLKRQQRLLDLALE